MIPRARKRNHPGGRGWARRRIPAIARDCRSRPMGAVRRGGIGIAADGCGASRGDRHRGRWVRCVREDRAWGNAAKAAAGTTESLARDRRRGGEGGAREASTARPHRPRRGWRRSARTPVAGVREGDAKASFPWSEPRFGSLGRGPTSRHRPAGRRPRHSRGTNADEASRARAFPPRQSSLARLPVVPAAASAAFPPRNPPLCRPRRWTPRLAPAFRAIWLYRRTNPGATLAFAGWRSTSAERMRRCR